MCTTEVTWTAQLRNAFIRIILAMGLVLSSRMPIRDAQLVVKALAAPTVDSNIDIHRYQAFYIGLASHGSIFDSTRLFVAMVLVDMPDLSNTCHASAMVDRIGTNRCRLLISSLGRSAGPSTNSATLPAMAVQLLQSFTTPLSSVNDDVCAVPP